MVGMAGERGLTSGGTFPTRTMYDGRGSAFGNLGRDHVVLSGARDVTRDGRWMVSEDQAPHESESSFEALDPRLTIFALANGMDLVKEPAARRLVWFSDRLERGILIGVDGQGAFAVHVIAWKSGDTDTLVSEAVADGADRSTVENALASAIERANELRLG